VEFLNVLCELGGHQSLLYSIQAWKA